VKDNRKTQNLTIGQYNCEEVESFTYLGAEINKFNIATEEIHKRIMAGNRAYHSNFKLLKSSLLSAQLKIKLYNTLIRPVITYGAETWTISTEDENALRVFESKVIRQIYGPTKDKHEWRIRTNQEIKELLIKKDIVRFIKARRIAWLGHVERMDKGRMPWKIMEEIYGVRRRGRPKLRWLDDV